MTTTTTTAPASTVTTTGDGELLSRRDTRYPVVPGRATVDTTEAVVRCLASKRAWTTRGIVVEEVDALDTTGAPRAGDLVLARVATLGQHKRLESVAGRRQLLNAGDEVLVAYGHRYAPDQYEASVPDDLGDCSLVAGGGIAGRVDHAHAAMGTPTALEPIGLLVRADGTRLTVRDRVLPAVGVASRERPITVVVAGASMNAGKTTSAAALVRGAVRAGYRVGAGKVTGTGSGGDPWSFVDAGASVVLDFSDHGHVTTCGLDEASLREVVVVLTDTLAAAGCEVVVLEVADGIYQRETAMVLVDPALRERSDGLLFAAGDALSTTAGAAWLAERGLEALAMTGVVSSSPLTSREAEAATGMAVWHPDQLADPDFAHRVVEQLRASRLPADGRS